MSAHPVIAGIAYLNSRPYFYPLVERIIAAPFDVVLTTPAEANRLLAEGGAVAGLVSSVEWLAHREDASPAGYLRIPGLEIASFGPVRSILLFAGRPWKELKSVAVTVESATSVKLLFALQRLARKELKILASREPMSDLRGGRCEGALLIGDAAIREPRGTWFRYDLGEMWSEQTGLPMTYAVFVVRRGHENLFDELRVALESALAWSRNNLDVIMAPVADEFRRTAPDFDMRDYLERFDAARGRSDLSEGLERFAKLLDAGS